MFLSLGNNKEYLPMLAIRRTQKSALYLELLPYFPQLIKKSHTSDSFLLAGDEARTRDILLGKEAFYH